MFQNIDPKKAGRSYKCCSGHPQAKALTAVQRQLLDSVDRYITAKKAWPLGYATGPNILALRHQSAIWALVAVKRDLQRGVR